ncbi:hypothetical protein FB567DRAFT_322127 [Paraphoma chrysanthemicola]|uniref:Uncharacterized protein n=1 Tax=Paraphoma chrysanthemicola TaxID=798071 RepID=A0A8K0RB91_9PLEO|nr:hypothetical protein FB567DRAFT_322127 [Paraphoma chrysanthemicola]
MLAGDEKHGTAPRTASVVASRNACCNMTPWTWPQSKCPVRRRVLVRECVRACLVVSPSLLRTTHGRDRIDDHEECSPHQMRAAAAAAIVTWRDHPGETQPGFRAAEAFPVQAVGRESKVMGGPNAARRACTARPRRLGPFATTKAILSDGMSLCPGQCQSAKSLSVSCCTGKPAVSSNSFSPCLCHDTPARTQLQLQPVHGLLRPAAQPPSQTTLQFLDRHQPIVQLHQAPASLSPSPKHTNAPSLVQTPRRDTPSFGSHLLPASASASAPAPEQASTASTPSTRVPLPRP